MALVEARDLVKHFAAARDPLSMRPRPVVRALEGVSFCLEAGETLALVGESGSGKTTAGRIALGLLAPTSGRVFFRGREITSMSRRALRELRPSMQIVFQDPYESLNPRMRVGEAVAEPLLVQARVSSTREARRRAYELLDEVGLAPELARRYPHQLSSGQRQRVAIARAIALRPEFIVCDEPVSALDVLVRLQVIELLERLQRERGIAYLLISHDLAIVRRTAQRVAVMYLGTIVEEGEVERVYRAPHHPYTQALLSAVPSPNAAIERSRRRIILRGEIPAASNPPPGCRFHTRCPLATDICLTQEPTAVRVGEGHMAACHFASPNPIGSQVPLETGAHFD